MCAELSKLTNIDEEWMKRQFIKRRRKFRNRLWKLIPQERKQQRRGLGKPSPELIEVYKKYEDEQNKVIDVRTDSLKKVIEAEREVAQEEKQAVTDFVDRHLTEEMSMKESLALQPLKGDATEGQVVLERLQNIDKRMTQLICVKGGKVPVKASSTSDIPLVGLHDIDRGFDHQPKETPGEFFNDAASPEELLTILRIIQYK